MSFNPIEFKNMSHDVELARYANAQLRRIVSLAPPGSVCVTVLEKTGRTFKCSMDICSRFGPFTVKAEGSSPSSTVGLLLKKAENKFIYWQERKLEIARSVILTA
jgi:hypothetical protein